MAWIARTVKNCSKCYKWPKRPKKREKLKLPIFDAFFLHRVQEKEFLLTLEANQIVGFETRNMR